MIELGADILSPSEREALNTFFACPLHVLACKAGNGLEIETFVLRELEKTLPCSAPEEQLEAWRTIFSPLAGHKLGRPALAPLLTEVIKRPALLASLRQVDPSMIDAPRALCVSAKATKIWRDHVSGNPLRGLSWPGVREMIDAGQLGALKQYFLDNPQPPAADPDPSALGDPRWHALDQEIALHWPLKTLPQALEVVEQSSWPRGLGAGALNGILHERGGTEAVAGHHTKRQLKALSKVVPTIPKGPRQRM